MTENYYYEYHKWSMFWGIFLKQREEVQHALDRYNDKGYKVVQFEWNTSKLSIFRWILILIATFLSLGFFSYWAGFSIVFEREALPE